jgi:hypothetical protein
MSASFYTVGTVYTVGTNPVLKLENVRNTRTFSEFIVRGATAGPLLVGKKVRLRNFPNVAGPQVFPYGYATGQAGLVPVPPVQPLNPFWANNLCTPDGQSIPVTGLNTFAANATKTKTGSALIWQFSYGDPYLTLNPAYSGGVLEGVFSLSACIYNSTGAAVTPKLICQSTAPNSATVNIGTITLEWNGTVISTSVNGVLDLTGVGAFPAPGPLPSGVAATSTIIVRGINYNLISGTLVFGMSL